MKLKILACFLATLGLTPASYAQSPWTTSGSNIYYSGGNAGIGTTNPGHKLEINGTFGATGHFTSLRPGSNTFLRYDDSGYSGFGGGSSLGSGANILLYGHNSSRANVLAFRNSGGERMTINSNGKVGIGTTSPSHSLTVGASNSTIAPWASTLVADGLAVSSSGNATGTYLYNESLAGIHGINAYNYGTGTYIPLYLGWGGNNVIIAKDGGNIGIGTTSPSGSISSNETGLHILDDNVSYLSLESTAGSGKQYTMYSSTTGSLVFWDASSSTLRGVVDKDGNWGIGVTNPLAKFSVDGFIKAQGADGRLMLENPSATSSIYLRNQGVSGQRRLELLYGPSTKLVMDNNGNVGIGTTNPLTNLQVGDGTTDASIRSYNSDNSYTEMRGYGIRSNRSVFYVRGTVDGTQTLRLGNTNTNFDAVFTHADNYISFANGTSEKVRFDMVNGNVGIGTTTPDEMLTVAGNIKAKLVKVRMDAGSVPDYVFAEDYNLRSLDEIEKFIKSNSHLPEIPSAKAIEENGLELGDMNMRLLKKIEELTLYTIQQESKINDQSKEIQNLQSNNDLLKIDNEELKIKNKLIDANLEAYNFKLAALLKRIENLENK